MFDTLFLGAGATLGALGVVALVVGAAVTSLADRALPERRPRPAPVPSSVPRSDRVRRDRRAHGAVPIAAAGERAA
ncbi:MAG: hypothetical protein S0880_33935 [Actinomycetota bacterium]|nr:hypothetical protein [Actinomycetota bacterium]